MQRCGMSGVEPRRGSRRGGLRCRGAIGGHGGGQRFGGWLGGRSSRMPSGWNVRGWDGWVGRRYMVGGGIIEVSNGGYAT